MEFRWYDTNEPVEVDPKNFLTKANVVDKIHDRFFGKTLVVKDMERIFAFLDFAISTKDIALIKKVHSALWRCCISKLP